MNALAPHELNCARCRVGGGFPDDDVRSRESNERSGTHLARRSGGVNGAPGKVYVHLFRYLFSLRTHRSVPIGFHFSVRSWIAGLIQPVPSPADDCAGLHQNGSDGRTALRKAGPRF